MGLAACEGDDGADGADGTAGAPGDVTTVEDTTSVNRPTGSVTGTVLDNNGNPIAGADVFLVGQTTTTDGGGVFLFDDVAVVNVDNGSGVAGDQTANGVLPITIVPPAGFLGATVNVTPEAQVFDSNNGTVGGTTNPNTVFVDGFTASAGVVRLPNAGTTVRGTLRNPNTGSPLPQGTPVALDFRGVTFDQNGGVGTAVTYATSLITGTVGTNGAFSLSPVSSDTCYDLDVTGYTVTGFAAFGGCAGAGSFSTTSEGTQTTVVGTTSAVLTSDGNNDAGGDTIPPYVVNVVDLTNYSTTVRQGGAGTLGAPGVGVLDDDRVGSGSFPLIVLFSEAINPARIDTNSVFVSQDNQNIALDSVTLDASGRRLNITTAAPLGEDDAVTVSLLTGDFRDLADNNLVSSFSVGVGAQYSVPFASIGGPNGQLVNLNLTTFDQINVAVGAPGLAAVTANDPSASAIVLADASDAFTDVIGDTQVNALTSTLPTGTTFTGIDQLNAAAPITAGAGTGFIASQLRLDNLATSLDPTYAGAPFVETAAARVAFTRNGTDIYRIATTRSGAALDVNYTLLPPTTDARITQAQPAASFPNTYVLDLNGETGVEILVTAGPAGTDNSGTPHMLPASSGAIIVPGDVFTAVPLDDLNNTGDPATLLLADTIAPTTALQFFTGGATPIRQTGGGTGGGLITPVNVSNGSVIFSATPQLLDSIDQADSADAGDDNNFAGDTLDDELNNLNIAPAPGLPANTYDATAWTAFTADLSRSFGIAVTEGIALQSTDPADLTIRGSLRNAVTFSAPGVALAQLSEDGSLQSDLFTLTVDNVMAMANVPASAPIDSIGLGGMIADLAGNPAGSDAIVEVRDVLPPFMADASLTVDGVSLVFNFNEAMATDTASLNGSIVLEDCGIVINPATTMGTTLTNGNRRITVPVAQVPGFSRTACFPGPAYAEPGEYTTPLDAPNHGVISWDSLEDANGNTWNAWSGQGLGIPSPRIAGADLLGPFSLNAAINTFFDDGDGVDPTPANGNRDGTVTVTVSLSHSIFDDLDADSNGNVNAAELNNYWSARMEVFRNGGGNSIAAPDGGGSPVLVTASNGFRTFQLTFNTVAAVDGSRVMMGGSDSVGRAISEDTLQLIAGQTIQSDLDPTDNGGSAPDDGVLRNTNNAAAGNVTMGQPDNEFVVSADPDTP